MLRKGTWIFAAFSAVFFLFLIGLTGYRVETVRENNSRRGGSETESLADRVLALRTESGGFQAAAFAKGIREESAKRPRFLLLCVRGTDGEILYLTTRNRSYLKRPDRVTADWRGTPSYAVRPGLQESFSFPFQTDGRTMILDGLYLVLSREDIYPILRDDLFLCLSFLLICGIALLLVSSYPHVEHQARSQTVYPRRPNQQQAREERSGETSRSQAPTMAMVPDAVVETAPVAVPAVPPAAAPSPVPDAAAEAASVTISDTVPDVAAAEIPAVVAVPDAVVDAAPAATTVTVPPSCPEPEEKTFFSPVSGLVWREYFLPRLRSEIERAASFDMDLSLCFLQADNRIPDDKRAEVLAAYSSALKSTFPLRDLIFEAGTDTFAVILPDTDIDQAVTVLENLREKLEALEVAGMRIPTSLGASSRGGRLIDEKSLLEEAEASLRKAHAEGGNQVVGFRADPMRFRETFSAAFGS